MTRDAFHGLLVLDKPGGITSRDAVDRALRWFPRRTRVGHTGTLDPLATGVLVLCVGAATRLTEYVQRMGKTYRTRLRLGATSDTDDADGTVTPVEGARPPSPDEIALALREFVGEIEQVPPAFSAAKVSGHRAYDLARRGEDVDLRPRRVSVYGIDVLCYEYPALELEVRCGKGTYIRSLARDLGRRLVCGALVEVLRRTRVGPFTEADAIPLDTPAEEARGRLLPLRGAVADLPAVSVSAEEVERLRRGQVLPLTSKGGGCDVSSAVALFDPAGELVAVGETDWARGVLRPVKVFVQSG